MNPYIKAISWTASGYLFACAHWEKGFPLQDISDPSTLLLMSLSLVCFLLPIASSFKLGGLLEYSAKVAEVRGDIKELKSETREMFKMQNAFFVSSSQSVQNNISIPSLTQAKSAELGLDEAASKIGILESNNSDIQSQLDEFAENRDLALMGFRRNVEVELRRILKNHNDFAKVTARIPPTGVNGLWRQLISIDKTLGEADDSMRFFLDLANAAAHGQSVHSDLSEEAILIGMRLLNLLKAQPTLELPRKL